GDRAAAIRWLPAEAAAWPEIADDPPALLIHAATCYGRPHETVAQLVEANVIFPLRVIAAIAPTAVLDLATPMPPDFNRYAESKADFARWAGRMAARLVQAPMQRLYGPGEDGAGVVPSMIRACLSGAATLDITSGTQRRDFIHVDDAARALALLARRMIDGAESPSVVEIGTGQTIAIKDLASLIARLCATGTRVAPGALPNRPGEPPLLVADPRYMLSLGWAPRISLERGLAAQIATYPPSSQATSRAP
ncbi:MAG: NAD-dependent epimerase/dehydratase family protein, partial [Alphaproteobacteria bacterium]|nr:NAD-dependent epimerase/dehydratase family protein [Alphaproteobacteria bacterium]